MLYVLDMIIQFRNYSYIGMPENCLQQISHPKLHILSGLTEVSVIAYFHNNQRRDLLYTQVCNSIQGCD